MFEELSHFSALADASNSTGNVMTENRVDTANITMPINNIVWLPPRIVNKPRPIKMIHWERFVLTCTTGTSLDLNINIEYAVACCTACPHSCAATAADATLLPL